MRIIVTQNRIKIKLKAILRLNKYIKRRITKDIESYRRIYTADV